MKKYTQDETNVSLARMVEQEGFLDKDLEVSLALCRTDGLDEIYGDAKGNLVQYGLRFVGRQLVQRTAIIIDPIELKNQGSRSSTKAKDKKGTSQAYRASGGNTEAENINRSIETDGWKLRELPIAVRYDSARKVYVLMEGRTRIDFFMNNKIIGNLIADVYELVDDKKNYREFNYFLNTVGSPKGFATSDDALEFLKSSLEQGELVYNKRLPEARARTKFHKDVTDILTRINATLTDKKFNKFINDVMGNTVKSAGAIGFNNGHVEAKELIEKWGYKSDKNIEYIVVSTDEWTAPLKTAVRKYSKTSSKKIRVVTYTQYLDGKDPVANWYLGNLRVGRKMEQRIKDVGEVYYPGCKPTSSNVEIYGTIPQCKALKDKYPMDKIVLYKDVTDEEYNEYGEE